MKIAELVATFPPHHGGMGYVCYHNALELTKRGHQVTVFTLDHGAVYDDGLFPFAVVRLKTPVRPGDAGVVPQLTWRLRDFDVVHLHYPFFGGAEYVRLAAMLHKKKYLLTYHMDVEGNSFVKKIALQGYEAIFAPLIVKGAARVGALSKAHLASSKFGQRVDWSNVVDLPNGVDVERFFPGTKNAHLVEKYQLQDKIVILFVGNLQPFKGVPLLVEAMAQIDDPRIVLLIVGGGYEEHAIRSQVEALGIEHKVIFAGPQSPADKLPDHYRLGDFLVLPSTYSESFGLVVLEAMASGIPVIVSALPGPSQLVDDGTDGLLVRVGDVGDLKEKIEHLASNPEIRSIMGQKARTRVLAHYSWERIGEHLESVLVDLVEGK